MFCQVIIGGGTVVGQSWKVSYHTKTLSSHLTEQHDNN